MWKDFSSPQLSNCRWYGGCEWSLAVAGQSSDWGETRLWRLHHQPSLDRIRCTLLRRVSFCPLQPFTILHRETLLLIALLCVFGGSYFSPRIWRVHAGDVSLDRMSLEVGTRVERIISHPKYNTDTNNNDIALLKLSTPLTFSSKYSPVK